MTLRKSEQVATGVGDDGNRVSYRLPDLHWQPRQIVDINPPDRHIELPIGGEDLADGEAPSVPTHRTYGDDIRITTFGKHMEI